MKNIVQPGTKEFKALLKKAHKIISKDLDEKVKLGVHEPGHGSAHMEMTLYFFNHFADLINISKEQKDTGALASIFHDIWRENIYYSHTAKSAEKASDIIDNHKLFKKNSLSDEVKNIVVQMVSLHSLQSMRTKSSSFPTHWQNALLALQVGDLVAQAGAFGYLRSYSYSGHVLKGMLGRIKTVIKDPKKYQDNLPTNLRNFLSETNNYFHAWILSIMIRTNRNYIDKTYNKNILKLADKLIKKGVDPDIIEDVIDKEVNENSSGFDDKKGIFHRKEKHCE